MFPRFLSPAPIRVSQLRAGRPGRRRPGHRPSDWTRARFRLEGLEDRCLLSGISAITEYPVPTANSGLDSITEGPDGNLWFTETIAGKIGMINPTTRAITEFTITNGGPLAITAGSDGNLWFTGYSGTSYVGMINPVTHAVSAYPVTTATPLQGITGGPDGNLWFTVFKYFQLGVINPTTHATNEFTLPATTTGDYFNYPWGITAGPDGNLWFTSSSGTIGAINPTTDAISEFATPTAGSGTKGIVTGSDGNLWFAEAVAGKIGMINPTTDAISEFVTPTTGSGPVGITAGPDGNLWFTETIGNIASINPTTDAVTEYPIPYANSLPGVIATGPDGTLWFTDRRTNSIGVATLATSSLVVAQQPPSSLTAGSSFGLTVEAEDSSGNLLSSFGGTVTVALASNPGGATLGGTLTATASGGVATFSGLSLTKAGSGYRLHASGVGLGQGITGDITVTPAAATQVVITQQPPGTVKVSSPFGLQASIEDQYGNVETTATNTVGVAFANNPTGAALGGTLSVTASQGVATFSSWTINKVGSGYALRVSSSGLGSALTNAINVTKTGKSNAIVATVDINSPDALLAPLVLDSPDFFDTLGIKKRGRRT